MFREMEAAGLPDPKYVQQDFILVATLQKTLQKNNPQNGSEGISQNPVPKKTLQIIELDIIGLIQKNPSISTTGMAKALGVSRQTIATRIKVLQASGVVRRIGPDKGGHWEVEL